jgi:hypothetical protein
MFYHSAISTLQDLVEQVLRVRWPYWDRWGGGGRRAGAAGGWWLVAGGWWLVAGQQQQQQQQQVLPRVAARCSLRLAVGELRRTCTAAAQLHRASAHLLRLPAGATAPTTC